jgi:bacterioferritin-associated ferredoxin
MIAADRVFQTIFGSQGVLMIVCVCNNVSDRKIRQAVGSGTTTMTELRTDLGVGTCCGKCQSCAKQVLRECLDEQQSRSMAFPFGAIAA